MDSFQTPADSPDVLIAEDDDNLRESYRFLFEVSGLTCTEASDGGAALAQARLHPPRLVLLDISLPDMDGFAVARRLRADPRTHAAHIHCLTGAADRDSRMLARLSGCELYLVKPVSPEVLLEIVRPHLPDEVGALTCDSLADAEELLDWLEVHGCSSLAITLIDGGVEVRCTCPPGLRLIRDPGGIPSLIRV
jgi:DNA-binding response OmpR family regulator